MNIMTQAELSRMLLKEGFITPQVVQIIMLLDSPMVTAIDCRGDGSGEFSVFRKTDGEGYGFEKI